MAQHSRIETVTLAQAKEILRCMADQHSILLLSGPGVGKSDCVGQAAAAAGLPCRSLVGTQIAPEDVSGIPRIIGERSVFCPPRVLLPENAEPFCLFLDELPACTPDVQKAFYSLLLEHRLGEHQLPQGTWVVAAGNRVEDRSLVRALSSALVNRVIILHVRVDVEEWLSWARSQNLRSEIIAFIEENPQLLFRPGPDRPVPFSTPRAWTCLAQALDRLEEAGQLNPELRLALAIGRVSAADAELFCQFTDGRRPNAVKPGTITVNLTQARALLHCLAAEQSLLLQGAARRGQDRYCRPGSGRGWVALPVVAGHPDRAGGCQRYPAHRRRALRVLPTARAVAGGSTTLLPVPR